MNRDTTVVVFGDDFWNTLGVIRSLGLKGVHPYFINVCSEPSWVKTSRYIKKIWQVGSFEEGYKILMNEIPSNSKSAIICTSDHLTKQLDEHYNELYEMHFHITK